MYILFLLTVILEKIMVKPCNAKYPTCLHPPSVGLFLNQSPIKTELQRSLWFSGDSSIYPSITNSAVLLLSRCLHVAKTFGVYASFITILLLYSLYMQDHSANLGCYTFPINHFRSECWRNLFGLDSSPSLWLWG